jgi:hypothetical protein
MRTYVELFVAPERDYDYITSRLKKGRIEVSKYGGDFIKDEYRILSKEETIKLSLKGEL